jgi:hypothetical protein
VGPRCLNCEDKDLASWLRPSSEEVEIVACEVDLVLRIDEEGEATLTGAREGALPLCVRASIEWSTRTRWEPASHEGAPVAVEVELPLIFSLDRLV